MEAARSDERAALIEAEGTRQRSSGDPFAAGISEQQMAARLEGRKLSDGFVMGGKLIDIIYRVDRFRRFLPGRGLSGRGLIQFWGVRASRCYKAGDTPASWSTAETETRMHTVEISQTLTVKKARARA